MTIYVATGDIVDYLVPAVGSLTSMSDTATLYRDTNFVNTSLSYNSISGAREGYIPLGSSLTDIWIHLRVYTSGVLGTTQEMFVLKNGTTDEYRVAASPGSSSILWKVQKTVDGTNWTDLVSFNLGLGTTSTLDIRIKAHATTGEVRVCVNGFQVGTFSGSTTSQTTAFERIYFRTGTAASSLSLTPCNELIVTDGATPTMGWRVQSILPNAAGTYSEWTGASTAIDEVVLDTSDFIISNTTGQRFTANYVDPTTTQLGSREIKGFTVTSTSAFSTDSTPTNLQHFLRSNSSDFTTANLGQSLDAVQRTFMTVYETNPATSAKFTLVEAAAIQFGVKTV